MMKTLICWWVLAHRWVMSRWEVNCNLPFVDFGKNLYLIKLVKRFWIWIRERYKRQYTRPNDWNARRVLQSIKVQRAETLKPSVVDPFAKRASASYRLHSERSYLLDRFASRICYSYCESCLKSEFCMSALAETVACGVVFDFPEPRWAS